MTDIRKVAEERYPYWLPPEPGTPDPDYSEVDASWQNGMADDQRNAFIAGAEWMREQAAQTVERAPDEIPYTPRPGESAVANPPMRRISDIAAAIRKIGEGND